MKLFNLYKLGRYGYFHVTAYKFNSLKEAIDFYKKEFNVKKLNSKDLGSYKITGLQIPNKI